MKTLKLKQFALKQSMLHLSQNPSILSDAQLHSDYLSKKLDKSHDAFHLIDNNYHLNVVEPRLLKYLQESRVIKDSIVELPRFQVNIRVGFKGLSKGAYGQYVDPIDALRSPFITITGKNSLSYKVLLTITNLDNPCVESKSFNEFDLKMVNGYLVVKGGDSRFLTNHFESSIVDNESETRFSYLPLHPPFSNPNLQQRYLVSVYKQPDNFKLNPLSLNFCVESSKENQTNDSLEYNARRIGSSFRFQQFNQLELLGVGAFTSGNTVETSRIFESLGLHEQVFGKLVGNTRKLVEKIQSTQIGTEKFKPFPKIPTLNEQRIPAYDGFQVEKRKSLGIIERVAMVKNRPSDIASTQKGEISERVNARRNRYQFA